MKHSLVLVYYGLEIGNVYIINVMEIKYIKYCSQNKYSWN
jgi:hypothetical protein